MMVQMPRQRTVVVGIAGSFISCLFIIRTIGYSDIFGYYNNLILSKYMETITESFIETEGITKNHTQQALANSGVTLVTAYFDIGSFPKGDDSNMYRPSMYEDWMSIFQLIDNPLYVYVDEIKYVDVFNDIRKRNLQNRTKIILLDRKELWSFNLKQNISSIFSDPKYPKFYPNTVIADYSCAMHAKFEVVQKAIEDNQFNTKYFAWIDIGQFRDLVNTTSQAFKIDIPTKFNESRVAYNQVFSPMRRTLKQIIRNNEVWVGGAFFIAEKNVMQKWVEDYMYYTERFIELKWISTDQQVIYAMAQPSIHKKLGKRRVFIQPYHIESPNSWFGLGYLCKNPS